MARNPVVAQLVFDRLPTLRGQMRTRAGQMVRKAALDVEAHAKASMAGPKSGRVYERSGDKTHQASAPGEAPAIDTGALANSIQTTMEGDLAAIVATNMEYAAELEYGRSGMAPRPYMGPAVEAVRPGFMAAMRQLL